MVGVKKASVVKMVAFEKNRYRRVSIIGRFAVTHIFDLCSIKAEQIILVIDFRRKLSFRLSTANDGVRFAIITVHGKFIVHAALNGFKMMALTGRKLLWSPAPDYRRTCPWTS